MKQSPLNYALWLLQKRDRSVWEIKSKLKNKGVLDIEAEKVVKLLTEKNFLDDKKFAVNYIKNQIGLKPQGKYRLKQKLKQFHLEQSIIDFALSQVDKEKEEKLLLMAYRKWIKVNGAVADQKNREKLLRHLLSRGFDYDIIKEVLG